MVLCDLARITKLIFPRINPKPRIAIGHEQREAGHPQNLLALANRPNFLDLQNRAGLFTDAESSARNLPAGIVDPANATVRLPLHSSTSLSREGSSDAPHLENVGLILQLFDDVATVVLFERNRPDRTARVERRGLHTAAAL